MGPPDDRRRPAGRRTVGGDAHRSRIAARGATAPRGRARAAPEPPRGARLLESILLGAAYPLGLVRAAEERGTGRRVVQLTPLGRYVLAAGPTPPPRPAFEQFLFVQPNFEVIAYRQGLTPQLVGRLSRFAWWAQIGAALELRLTRESILLGLDGGLTPESMLEVLTRHSQRRLPAGVVDAVRTWATHRERVTYYAAATLIEFGSRDERDQALESWPRDERGSRAADRRRRSVPAGRRRAGDPVRPVPHGRLARLPAPAGRLRDGRARRRLDGAGPGALGPAGRRRARPVRRRAAASQPARAARGAGRAGGSSVTAASLRRGLDRGLTPQDLADWYDRRTGGEIPPAVRLLLAPAGSRVPTLKAARMLVLTLPDAGLLDGLLQHPATSPWLGDRLGPTAVDDPRGSARAAPQGAEGAGDRARKGNERAPAAEG